MRKSIVIIGIILVGIAIMFAAGSAITQNRPTIADDFSDIDTQLFLGVGLAAILVGLFLGRKPSSLAPA